MTGPIETTVKNLIFIGISTTLDNLTVGIALGLTGKAVPLWLHFQVATANAFFTGVGMYGGSVVGDNTPDWVNTVVPGIIFIGIGFLMCGEWLLEFRAKPQLLPVRDKDDPERAPGAGPGGPAGEGTELLPPNKRGDEGLLSAMALMERTDFTHWHATVPLTLGLCINNVGGGIAAGMAGMEIIQVCATVLMFSLIFFAGGMEFGCRTRSAARSVNLRTSYISLIAGVMLISLGLTSLYETEHELTPPLPLDLLLPPPPPPSEAWQANYTAALNSTAAFNATALSNGTAAFNSTSSRH